MAAPTFISEAEVANWAWVAIAAKTTAAFNADAGDLLVAFATGLTGSTTETPLTIADTAGLTWTKVLENTSGDTAWSYIAIWTATVPSNQTGMTVTFTKKTANSWPFGGAVQVWRASGGTGATKTDRQSGLPPAAEVLTTTVDNSAVLEVNVDWNANSGTTRTWTNAGAVETVYQYTGDSTGDTSYAAYTPDNGAAGLKTFGMTDPFNQKYTYAAIEIKGVTGPTVTAELWEGGNFKQALGSFPVSADGVISLPWDASVLTVIAGTNVELRLSSDLDLDIGAIEWNAVTEPVPAGAPTTEIWGARML